MSTIWMDVGLVVDVPVNALQLTDDADFKTIEASVAYNAAGLLLFWNFVTTSGVTTQERVIPTTGGDLHDWTNLTNGMYSILIPIDLGDVNNLVAGFGYFTGVATGVLPWRGPTIGFRNAPINEALIDDATTWTALADQYDGATGLDGGTYPATQDQVSQIGSGGGAATNEFVIASPNGFFIIDGHGANEQNNEDATVALDGILHQIDDDGDELDGYYLFSIGAAFNPTNIIHDGRSNGNNQDLDVYVNINTIASPSWQKRATLIGTALTTDIRRTWPLAAGDVMTGADAGKVAVRFQKAGLTNCTLSTDQILVEKVAITSDVGYANGAIWFNSAASNENTVAFVDGVADKPVSSWAAVKTLIASTGLKKVEVSPGSTLTLDANANALSLRGDLWTLALEGESLSATHVHGADVSGVCTGATPPHFMGCHFGNTSVPPSHIEKSGFEGTLTLTGAGEYFLDGCHAAALLPVIDFEDANENKSVYMTAYAGDVEIRNIGQAGSTDVLHLDGDGKLVLASTCEAATIEMQGMFEIEDNVSGGFVAGAGGTLSDEARFATTQVTAIAKTFYVTTGGNDSNTGRTEDDSFLTPAHAIETGSGEGDTINIGPGTFGQATINAGEFAVDKGLGLVGIPSTGHRFSEGDSVVISGTQNYDATETVHGDTSTDETVITAGFTAEVFGGSVIDADDAVDNGNGLVGIPITGQPFTEGDSVTISGTDNYDGTETIHATTSVDEIVIDKGQATFDDEGDAVDLGGGLVRIPATAHGFADGVSVDISGSTNYDGTHILHANTSPNQLVITADFTPEEFSDTDTATATFLPETFETSDIVYVADAGEVTQTRQISPQNGQTITGVGKDATIIKGDIFVGGTMNIGLKSSVTVSDLKSQNTNASGIGFKVTNADNIRLERCAFEGPFDGLRCDGMDRSLVLDCEGISEFDPLVINGTNTRVKGGTFISEGIGGDDDAPPAGFHTGHTGGKTQTTTYIILEGVTFRVDRVTAESNRAVGIEVNAFARVDVIDCNIRVEADGTNTGDLYGISAEDSAQVNVSGGFIETINAGSGDKLDLKQEDTSTLQVDEATVNYDSDKTAGTITNKLGVPIQLDSGTASIAGMLAKLADDNDGADFDAELHSQVGIVTQGNAAWATGEGSGSGARTVTVTVDDGATVLENATVRFTEGANTFTGLTNASGVIVFSLDDATYAVTITKDGYSFTPTTKIVNGTEADTYSMEVVAITAPPNASTTTGVGTTYDEEQVLEEGVSVNVQILDGPGTDGIAYDSAVWTELSNVSGVVQFAGIVHGARYKIWRGHSKANAVTFTAPTSGTSFDLPEVIGRG